MTVNFVSKYLSTQNKDNKHFQLMAIHYVKINK